MDHKFIIAEFQCKEQRETNATIKRIDKSRNTVTSVFVLVFKDFPRKSKSELNLVLLQRRCLTTLMVISSCL